MVENFNRDHAMIVRFFIFRMYTFLVFILISMIK